jgi:hypothetical protein
VENYLRSKTPQKMVNDLAILYIGMILLDKIDIDIIINNFVSRDVIKNFQETIVCILNINKYFLCSKLKFILVF